MYTYNWFEEIQDSGRVAGSSIPLLPDLDWTYSQNTEQRVSENIC